MPFLVEENHATVKNDSSVAPRWNGNLQRRQHWAAKSTKLKENAGKIKSAFVVRAALSAEKLGCYLENCRSWKNTLGKLVVVNLEAIWLEWKESKWQWRVLSSVVGDSHIVSETHFGCVLCPETDWNIRIGKQGYVFILSDFKKCCFDVSFLTSISVSTVILTLGKVEFFK